MSQYPFNSPFPQFIYPMQPQYYQWAPMAIPPTDSFPQTMPPQAQLCPQPYMVMSQPSQQIESLTSVTKVPEEKMEQKPPAANAQKKRYTRTWSNQDVKHLYSICTDYCLKNSKPMESLSYSDFEVISKQTKQSSNQCMLKINEIITSGTLKSGVWLDQEDQMLQGLIQQGGKRWGEIANQLNSEFHRGFRIRSGKQAKERWNNHLNPEINKGPWTLQEDLILLESHKKLKNRWSLIAKELENRTESSIKNRVKSLLNNSMLDLEFSIDPDKALDKLILRLKIEISGYVNAEESASPPSGHERTPNSNHNKKVNFSIASELTSEMAYK